MAGKSKQKTDESKSPDEVLKADRPAGRKSPASRKGKPQRKRPEARVSEDILYKVIDRMCEGESLRQICKDPKMPSVGTVLRYALMKGDLESEEYVQRFAAAYEVAKQVRAEAWADEMVELSDSVEEDRDSVAKGRLQVDTRKWLLSKLLKQYGDKQSHEISGPGGGPVQSETKTQVQFYLPKNGREAK